MLTLDRLPSADLPDSETARTARVRLRPNGPELELRVGKTTIGSSPRCDIRIQQPGVQPLHCLILNDARGLAVRRWSGATLLNGEPQNEACLAPGDCLQAGPAELEVIESTGAPSSMPGRVTALQAEMFAPNTSPTLDRLRADRNAARSRTRRMLKALRSTRDAGAQLRQRHAELEGKLQAESAERLDLATQLHASAVELAELRERIATQDAEAASENSMRAELSELSTRATAAALRVEEVEQALAKSQLLALELENQFNTCRGERDDALQQCEILRSNLRGEAERSTTQADEIRALEHESSQLHSQLAELSNKIASLLDELHAARDESERLRSDRKAAEHSSWGVGQAEENATLTTSLGEVRHQLADVEHAKAELAAQLEAALSRQRELEAVQQNDGVNAADLARMERELDLARQIETRRASELVANQDRVAELERAAAESRSELLQVQEQLSEAQRTTPNAESERQLWEQERAELLEKQEQLLAEVSALNERLAKTDFTSAATKQADSATDFHSGWGQSSAENTEQRLESPEPSAAESHFDFGGPSETSGAFDWSAASQGSSTFGEPQADDQAESTPALSWRDPSANSTWPTAEADSHEELNDSDPFENQAPAFGSADVAKIAEPSVDENVPAALFVSKPVVDAPPATLQPEPTSFIERDAHMFNDDPVANAPAASPILPKQSTDDSPTRKTGRPAAGSSNSNAQQLAASGDEESIEEYMAKLLQRVRGESATSVHASASVPENAPVEPHTSFESAPLTSPPTSVLADGPLSGSFEFSKRKSSMPEPQTDLEALRALANESARRAISRHSVRKHRRNAVTKMIVSTLAGFTSLWLMLDSPHWLTLQFITACVSMLVAAYWAGETLRMLLQTLKVGLRDETDHEIEELSGKLRSQLPIDLVSPRPWNAHEVAPESGLTASEPTTAL